MPPAMTPVSRQTGGEQQDGKVELRSFETSPSKQWSVSVRRRRSVPLATNRPATPPSPQTTCSPSASASSRDRDAPTADRIAISRRRPTARASMTLATLVQAMRSRSRRPPSRPVGPVAPDQQSPRVATQRWRRDPRSSQYTFEIVADAIHVARAASSETPGFRRA